MKLTDFITSVDNLVREWATDEPRAGAIPRAELEVIFNNVREQAVHDLAEAIEQRDEAMRQLHEHYLKDRYPKGVSKPK